MHMFDVLERIRKVSNCHAGSIFFSLFRKSCGIVHAWLPKKDSCGMTKKDFPNTLLANRRPNACFLFVLIFLLAKMEFGYAGDIFVGESAKFKTIRAALEHAAPGDRIFVQAGTYREGSVVISKPVELLGESGAIIDGEKKHQPLLITADNVRISGFTIRDVGVSYVDDNAAIKVANAENVIIENNLFDDAFFGVYLAKASNVRIENNIFAGEARREANSGNGVHAWSSENIQIFDNTISGHRDGIYLEFVEKSNVRGNLSENNLRYGLHFMFSHDNEYTENTFRHNGAGVAVMYTKRVLMRRNRFERNWGSASYGLLLKEINDSQITENVFAENSIGIYTEASNRLHVFKNTFRQNGWAVKIMANSMDNKFEKNNFLDNSFEVATNSRQNFNTLSGNFWSRYKGYDLERDGIGDQPHRPVRLFSILVEKQAPALILMRSVFIDLLDVAERAFPVLTPETLLDQEPAMRKFNLPHTTPKSQVAEVLTGQRR